MVDVNDDAQWNNYVKRKVKEKLAISKSKDITKEDIAIKKPIPTTKETIGRDKTIKNSIGGRKK